MVLTPATHPSTPAAGDPLARAVEALLDGERTKAVLQSQLPWLSDRGHVIRRCVVDSVRYNSRAKDRNRQRPLVCVGYRLDLADAGGRELPGQILYAEVHPNRLGRSRSTEPAGPAGDMPESGRAVLHLPDLDAIVWSFPHDPVMPHLPEAMDPERVKRSIPYDRLPAGLDGPADVREVRVEVLRYKPETHCAARYEIVAEGSGGAYASTLFGKSYAGNRAGELHRQIEAVWGQSAAEPSGFLIARALGHAPSIRTVWQEWLVGSPLLPVIGSGDCDDVLGAAGTALAILHETRAFSSVTVGLGDQLAELQAQVAALVEAFPEVQGTLEPIAARLRAEVPGLTAAPASLVHGDFIAKNLAMHDGRLVICDFDDFVIGDPAQDVARFLVDLHFLENRDSHLVTLRQRDRGVVEAMANVFADAYRSRARWKVSEELLDWHGRVQWIAKMHYYFKRQHLRPGFERDLREMLAWLD